VIRGFENAVLGMSVGEKKRVTIPPEDAYGVNTNHPLSGKTLIFDIHVLAIEKKT